MGCDEAAGGDGGVVDPGHDRRFDTRGAAILGGIP